MVDTASLIERRRQILLNTPHLTTASANPLTFQTDILANQKDCKIYFEPVQDLHGYDNPWPAGGGKNLWGGLAMANDIASATGVTIDTNNRTVSIDTGSAEAVLTSGIEFKENAQYTFILDGTYFGHANLMFVYTDGTNDRGLGRYINAGANVSAPGKTIQSIVKRNYSNTTIINYETSGLFEGVKTANDYEPYENICPIAGWDGVTVYKAGKSFYEPLNYTQYVNGTAKQYWGTNVGVVRDAINKLPKGRQYSIIFDFKVDSVDASATNIEYGMQLAGTGYSGGRTRIAYSNRTVGQVIHTKCSFFLKENANITQAYFYASHDFVILQNFMIIEGNTDSTYEPYAGTSITIPFPQTIYGGYVDLVNGEVVEEWAIDTYTDSDAWLATMISGQPAFQVSRKQIQTGATFVSNLIKRVSSLSSGADNSGYAGGTYLNVKMTSAETIDEFKTLLATNSLQIAYKLATPITHQLTPQTIKTLKGINNIWSDANGNIEVKFWKH